VIIGSGPAGWTAAIYAARANLAPVLYADEGRQEGPLNIVPGGQLMFTTDVENYPGFPEGVLGPDMMQKFEAQASRFDTRIVRKMIPRLDLSARPFKLWDSEDQLIEAHSVIICTGATANWLGLPNELRLASSGGGVSACAVCDGALPRFRNKPLAVVGGGDSAVEEATYLTKFASKVYMVHRRDELRASKIMQQRALTNPKIEMKWNSTIDEVLGTDKAGVTAVKIKSTVNDSREELEAGGMFLAIGHTPNTTFLKGHLELHPTGYIKWTVPFRTFTSVEGVFAAGDVADDYYKQAVTAAGSGCQAALDAERWLGAKGHH
jgi:thioredoxin reductase (NADPH)